MNFKVGQWVAKKSGNLFNSEVAIRLKKLPIIGNNCVVVKGVVFGSLDDLEVISKDEYYRRKKILRHINVIWDNPNYESDACTSSVTGEPKVGKSLQSIYEDVYRMTIRRPEVEWLGYLCGHCNQYHLGKNNEK